MDTGKLCRSIGMDWATQERQETASRKCCSHAAAVGTPTTQQGRSRQTAGDSSTSAVALAHRKCNLYEVWRTFALVSSVSVDSQILRLFLDFSSPPASGSNPFCLPHTCLDAVDRPISRVLGQVAFGALPKDVSASIGALPQSTRKEPRPGAGTGTAMATG